MNKLGFIITAFEQVDLTRQNVDKIRSFVEFAKSPIVVVSTSTRKLGFSDIPDIEFIHFVDAPGNPDSSHKSYPQEYINWHQEFLPQRILHSIAIAANRINSKYVLHLHSDTFWQDEQKLIDEVSFMESNGVLAIGDLAISCENVCSLPKGFHFNPEGMLLNTEFARTIKNMFDYDKGFRSHNYGSIEAMIGQYLHYYISGNNILTYDDMPHEDYNSKVIARCIRGYHGDFGHLNNLPGKQ
jgi:hypothetical protein